VKISAKLNNTLAEHLRLALSLTVACAMQSGGNEVLAAPSNSTELANDGQFLSKEDKKAGENAENKNSKDSKNGDGTNKGVNGDQKGPAVGGNTPSSPRPVKDPCPACGRG
jgi:hypothetical protein